MHVEQLAFGQIFSFGGQPVNGTGSYKRLVVILDACAKAV